MKWIGDADNNIEDNNHACAGTYHLEAATTAVYCLLMYNMFTNLKCSVYNLKLLMSVQTEHTIFYTYSELLYTGPP